MEMTYERDGAHSYLVSEQIEEPLRRCYEYQMILQNKVPGLLPCRERLLEGTAVLRYEISGRQTLVDSYANGRMDGSSLLKIVEALAETFASCDRYLLDAGKILTDPAYIYRDGVQDAFWFVYCPQRIEEEGGFRELAGFFLDRVEKSDKEAVRLAYDFYQESKHPDFSVRQFLAMHDRREPAGGEKSFLSDTDKEAAGYHTDGGMGDMDYSAEKGRNGWKKFGAGGERKAGMEGRVDSGAAGRCGDNRDEWTGLRAAGRYGDDRDEWTGLGADGENGKSISGRLGFGAAEKPESGPDSLAGAGGAHVPKGREEDPKRRKIRKKEQSQACLYGMIAGLLLAAGGGIFWCCLLRLQNQYGSAAADAGKLILSQGLTALGGIIALACGAGFFLQRKDALQEQEEAQDQLAQRLWDGYARGQGELAQEYEMALGEQNQVTQFIGAQGRSLADGSRMHRLVSADKRYPLEYTFSQLPVVVGKLQGQADIRIEEETVSRLHARFFRKEGKIAVMDLNSTNGTFVNGIRLEPEEQVILESRDEICFGQAVFLFE